MRSLPILVGNWKMHKTGGEAIAFVEALRGHAPFKVPLFLAVPFTVLSDMVLQVGEEIGVGAQNLSDKDEGACTGEISARMVRGTGAHFALVGHSERRRIFYEDDASIGRKVVQAQTAGLTSLLCIGETWEEREADHTAQVLERQLEMALENALCEKLMIAYEPVWAIGSGRSATPDMAQEAHHICRSVLKKRWDDSIALRIPILYGGSVVPGRLAPLLARPDIDGVLVGGASLQVETFVQLIREAESTSIKKF